MKEIFILIATLFVTSAIMAQNETQQVVVEKSTNKVKINGDIYYVHIVKQHETLYSISKAYEVSQSDIADANPDIYAELKVGQALKIPAKDQVDSKDDRYIYHIVKRKETIYSLTKKYNISQEDLIAINPAIKDGLKKSQLVLIPKKLEESASIQLPDSLEFVMHEVQKSEGLLAISRKYGVSTRDIEYYNRDLLVEGVKLGSVLRIPMPKPKVEPVGTDNNSTNIAIDEQVEPQATCINNYQYDGSAFNISLLLPFTQVSQNELNLVEEQPTTSVDVKAKPKASQTTQSALEFYEGFLLAIDSMKRDGVSVNIEAFDTKKQPVEVNSIIASGKLKNSDLIIGSFFIDEILPIAKYAVNEGINIVSPSYNGPTEMPYGNNVITVNQSFKEQFDSFVTNLKLTDSVNYIIVYDGADNYSSSHKFCDSVLNQKFAKSNIVPQVYKHRIGRNSIVAQDSIFLQVDSLGHNVFIVPSEDEPFVSEMMGNIYGVKNFHNIQTQVFGPARWRRMKNISPEYLYNLNLYIYSPFFVDYSMPDVQQFVANYREIYRAEPSDLSFLGYDVGIYFISALKKFGPNFNDCLPTYNMNGLQIDFSFGKNSRTLNLQNTDQIIMRYTNDFEVVRAK